METRDYIIDMKFFCSVPQEEIAIAMPPEMISYGCIKPGIHQVILNATKQLLDDILESTFTHPDIKVLGIHYLNLNP